MYWIHFMLYRPVTVVIFCEWTSCWNGGCVCVCAWSLWGFTSKVVLFPKMTLLVLQRLLSQGWNKQCAGSDFWQVCWYAYQLKKCSSESYMIMTTNSNAYTDQSLLWVPKYLFPACTWLNSCRKDTLKFSTCKGSHLWTTNFPREHGFNLFLHMYGAKWLRNYVQKLPACLAITSEESELSNSMQFWSCASAVLSHSIDCDWSSFAQFLIARLGFKKLNYCYNIGWWWWQW